MTITKIARRLEALRLAWRDLNSAHRLGGCEKRSRRPWVALWWA